MIKILKPGTLKKEKKNKRGAVLNYDESKDVKEENIEKHFVTNISSGFGYNKYTLFVHSARIKLF